MTSIHGDTNGEEEIDLYATLNLEKTCSEADIKKNYRQLALRYHPDKNPNNPEAEEKFKGIAKAYLILSDADKRAVYDKYGAMGLTMMEKMGDGSAKQILRLSSPCAQALFCFMFLITGCCFCCCCFLCCCGCCGKWAKQQREQEAAELRRKMAEDGIVITNEPQGGGDTKTNVNSHNSTNINGTGGETAAPFAMPYPSNDVTSTADETDVIPETNVFIEKKPQKYGALDPVVGSDE